MERTDAITGLLLMSWAAAMPMGAARAHDAAGARLFTRHLYDPFLEHQPTNDRPGETDAGSLGCRAASIYDASLLRLITTATTAGVSPVLDGDPVCDCQDAEGLTPPRVTARMLAPGVAESTAIFTIGGDPRRVSFRLVWTAAGWRVDDVRSARAARGLRAFIAARSR